MISLFNKGKSFSGVCPFDFYGICNEQELASGCVYGKISVLFMISDGNLHFSVFEGSGNVSCIFSYRDLPLNLGNPS